VNKTWSSQWFTEKNYSQLLHEDIKIRRHLKKKFYHAGISKIDIERAADKAKINIHTARPGIIIGRKGSEIEKSRRTGSFYVRRGDNQHTGSTEAGNRCAACC
jgi:small subunit ribosomal protein S3